MSSAEKIIFSMRHRVVLPGNSGPDGATAADNAVVNATAKAEANGDTVARQVDAVLMKAGFKCSGELLSALGALPEGPAIDTG